MIWTINNSVVRGIDVPNYSNVLEDISMNIYYVYAYLRNKDSITAIAGTPYYIGKGKHNRKLAKHSNAPVPTDHYYIHMIAERLREQEAHLLEIELITKYGRKDIGTGILNNKTAGGEGSSGRILSADTIRKMSKPKSEETKKKMSASRTGRIFSVETKAKMKASALARPPKSEETRRKLSVAGTGKTRSNETKEKMKLAQQQRWNNNDED